MYEKDYPQHLIDSFSAVGECYMIMQGASEFVSQNRVGYPRGREKDIKVPCIGTDDERRGSSPT